METLNAYFARQGRGAKGDFARQLGIAPAYLSQILGGNKRPGFDLMVRIERATDGAVPITAWVDHASSPSSVCERGSD